MLCFLFFFFKQKTAYEMRISDWSSDVCSSDLQHGEAGRLALLAVGMLLLLRQQGAIQRLDLGQRRRRRQPAVRVIAVEPALRVIARRDMGEDPVEIAVLRHVLHIGENLVAGGDGLPQHLRSEEHTSELQSLMRISY